MSEPTQQQIYQEISATLAETKQIKASIAGLRGGSSAKTAAKPKAPKKPDPFADLKEFSKALGKAAGVKDLMEAILEKSSGAAKTVDIIAATLGLLSIKVLNFTKIFNATVGKIKIRQQSVKLDDGKLKRVRHNEPAAAEEPKLSAIKETLDGLGPKIDGVKEHATGLVNGLNDKITGSNTKMDELKETMRGFNNSMDGTSETLAQISREVHTLYEALG